MFLFCFFFIGSRAFFCPVNKGNSFACKHKLAGEAKVIAVNCNDIITAKSLQEKHYKVTPFFLIFNSFLLLSEMMID